MEKDIQFKKNFIWNIIGTGFSSFNSLFFMIIITRINGVDNAGIYTLGYSTACILYMLGIYAGRVYQVTENDKRISNKDFILNRFISCAIIMLLVIGFVIYRKYNIFKSSIFIALAAFKALEALSEVFYGILQKNECLDKVGKSLFAKAILSVLVFIIIDLLTNNMLISCISTVVINFLVIVLYDVRQSNKFVDKTEKIEMHNVVNIFRDGFFPFAISFLGVFMVNAQKYAIDDFLSEDIQAIFGIIIMPATVMGLLVQFLIHPYLNRIFELYKSNDYKEIKKILFKIIMVLLVMGTLICIVGYFLGTPVLGFVYGLDLSAYSVHLLLILIAATFFTMAGIISPVLITMRINFIQFVIYVIIAVFEMIISNIFVEKYGINGAVWAYLVTMIVYFIIFYFTAMTAINKKSAKVKESET